jgi:hypothetical protein
MKRFTVYFTLYGKKMKVTKMALSKDDVKTKVKNDIQFDLIRQENDDTVIDFFKDMFRMK